VDPATLHCQPGESQRLRGSLAIPPHAVVFLNVGRLDPAKGQTCLLRAFQRVATQAPDAFLVLAGDGPDGEALKSLAGELGIAKKVRFLGRRTDIGVCLEMADVFVFPTLFEGLGLALVEAMFKKLPCIASRIDVLLEVIPDQESGLVVSPGSVDALADAMIRLQADPILRRALGLQAQKIADARFHQRVTTPQWEKLYSRIIEQSSSNGKRLFENKALF
jgi:glycosyltransferase involved in cell wall biosynthesis